MGAACEVPPPIVGWPSRMKLTPVKGSATADTSGVSRLPVARPDGTAPCTPRCHGGRSNSSETPPLVPSDSGTSYQDCSPNQAPVAVVDKVVDKKGTRKEAETYLKFLYSDEGQEVAAKHHIRPRSATVMERHAKDFPTVKTFTVDELFGGWNKAQAEHFNDGGSYDQVIAAAKKR